MILELKNVTHRTVPCVPEYLKKYFKNGKASISIQYRRKYGDTFKQVAMEMIPADDYKPDNQTLFLYVKNIDI